MTKKPNEKRRQIAELYPELTHLKSESGGPLCNAKGIKPEQLVEKDARWRLSPATNRPALPVNGKRNEG